MTAPPITLPQQTPWGWTWSVPGDAEIEATREAAEAKIRKHQGRTP